MPIMKKKRPTIFALLVSLISPPPPPVCCRLLGSVAVFWCGSYLPPGERGSCLPPSLRSYCIWLECPTATPVLKDRRPPWETSVSNLRKKERKKERKKMSTTKCQLDSELDISDCMVKCLLD